MRKRGLAGHSPPRHFQNSNFPDQNSSPPRLGPRPRTFFMSMSIKFIFKLYKIHKHNTLIIIIKLKMVNFRFLDIVKSVKCEIKGSDYDVMSNRQLIHSIKFV